MIISHHKDLANRQYQMVMIVIIRTIIITVMVMILIIRTTMWSRSKEEEIVQKLKIIMCSFFVVKSKGNCNFVDDDNSKDYDNENNRNDDENPPIRINSFGWLDYSGRSSQVKTRTKQSNNMQLQKNISKLYLKKTKYKTTKRQNV